MTYQVVVEQEAEADLLRLYSFMLERAAYLEDLEDAHRALEVIQTAIAQSLAATPFLFRRALLEDRCAESLSCPSAAAASSCSTRWPVLLWSLCWPSGIKESRTGTEDVSGCETNDAARAAGRIREAVSAYIGERPYGRLSRRQRRLIPGPGGQRRRGRRGGDVVQRQLHLRAENRHAADRRLRHQHRHRICIDRLIKLPSDSPSEIQGSIVT